MRLVINSVYDSLFVGRLKDSLVPVLLFVVLCLQEFASGNPLPPAVSDEPSSQQSIGMRVSQMTFSEKLENPCALTESSAAVLRKVSGPSTDKTAMRTQLLTELRAKTILLKDTARTILRTNVLEDCSTLELPSVAVIPSLDEMSDRQPDEYLRLFYTSLLNHTAHVYFISDQQQRHTAADPNCGDAALSSTSSSLAAHMRELMCILRFSVRSFQDGDQDEEDASFLDSTAQILNEQLVEQPLCSRRSVRDCQIIGSTVDLLRTLSAYVEQITPHSNS